MGGLAHVQTLKNKVIAQYGAEKVVTALAGDLYSPSALNSAMMDETDSFNGRHMVDCLNNLKLDVCTLGNHEFDMKESVFMQRLSESKFPYVAVNVRRSQSMEDPNVPDYDNIIPYHLDTRNGITALYVSIVIDVNKGVNNYAHIDDINTSIEMVQNQLAQLKNGGVEYDILIALTHVSKENDEIILERIPEIDLLIGGHEHTNMKLRRGPRSVSLTKADSNVKTMFLHTLQVDKKAGQKSQVRVDSELIYVEPENFPSDPAMAAVVDGWWQLAKTSFLKNNKIDIEETVVSLPVDYDLRDIVVRSQTYSDFNDLLLQAFTNAAKEEGLNQPQFSLFHGGAIRIDDKLLKGPMTMYDVLRVLPYAGSVVSCQATGAQILAALTRGSVTAWGGFVLLHRDELRRTPSGAELMVDGNWVAIQPDTAYTFITSDFIGIQQGDALFPVLQCQISQQSQQQALKTMLKHTFGTRMYKRDKQPTRTYRLLDLPRNKHK